MIWSKLSLFPDKPENEEEKKLLPTKASQPAPIATVYLGSTLETIHSQALDVLPNPFCGRIGEDKKKVVKFVTQESKFTHTHTHTLTLFLGLASFSSFLV
jgi:hypothetical protein